MAGIYLLRSSENKNYVGVSTDCLKRIKTHLSGHGSRLVKEALEAKVSFDYEILMYDENVPKLYSLEQSFIDEYNCMQPYGYNIAKGGLCGGVSNRQGSNNSQAVLCEESVLNIREEYALGSTTQEILASIYAVNRETISAIVRGKSWKNVGGPITIKLSLIHI